MDKDTKFIFIMLAIIVILAGVFIWKIVTPQEEQGDFENEKLNQIESVQDELIGEDYIENIKDLATIRLLKNDMEETDEMAVKIRNFFIVVLLITVVVIIIKRMNPNSRIGKKTIIALVIYTSLCGMNTMRYVFRSNAIEYAIQNKSWYIEKDTVRRVKEKDGIVYVYLEKHGEQMVTSIFASMYDDKYKSGDEVEILMVKGKFGGKYEIALRQD